MRLTSHSLILVTLQFWWWFWIVLMSLVIIWVDRRSFRCWWSHLVWIFWFIIFLDRCCWCLELMRWVNDWVGVVLVSDVESVEFYYKNMKINLKNHKIDKMMSRWISNEMWGNQEFECVLKNNFYYNWGSGVDLHEKSNHMKFNLIWKVKNWFLMIFNFFKKLVILKT